MKKYILLIVGFLGLSSFFGLNYGPSSTSASSHPPVAAASVPGTPAAPVAPSAPSSPSVPAASAAPSIAASPAVPPSTSAPTSPASPKALIPPPSSPSTPVAPSAPLPATSQLTPSKILGGILMGCATLSNSPPKLDDYSSSLASFNFDTDCRDGDYQTCLKTCFQQLTCDANCPCLNTCYSSCKIYLTCGQWSSVDITTQNMELVLPQTQAAS